MNLPNWTKNWEKIKLLLWFIGGVFIGNVFVFVFLAQPVSLLLDVWSKLVGIVGGISIALAAANFLYQREQDRAKYAIDLLKPFREEIISKTVEMQAICKRLGPTYLATTSWPIKKFDLEFYKSDQPQGYKTQASIIDKQDKEYAQKHMELLNALEEFSLKVIYTDIATHGALESLRNVFLKAVEQNYVGLEVLIKLHGNGSFPGIKKLYELWKSRV